MNRFLICLHTILIRIFFYLSPIGIVGLIVSSFPHAEGTFMFDLFGGGIGTLISSLCLLWAFSSVYFFFSLLLSSKLRERVLSKLARMKEDDEREEQIVGQAAKSSYLFTLAASIVLFSVSICRYNSSVDALRPYHSFTIGHFQLNSNEESPALLEIDGKARSIQRHDLPLSKSAILLLLILIQISSYSVFATRYARKGNPC